MSEMLAEPRRPSAVPDPLDPASFAPPYELAGTVFALVGWWEEDPPMELPRSCSLLRVLGRPLGMLVGTSYTHPPRELPLEYRELVAAVAVRRGLSVFSMPFDMLLDEPVPVTLGRMHYGLPKRLDASLRFRVDGTGISVTGADTKIIARPAGKIATAVELPIRAAFSLGIRLVTKRIEVLGTVDGPARHAKIALAPKGFGDGYTSTSAVFAGRALRTLWCQSWDFTSTWIGPPRTL